MELRLGVEVKRDIASARRACFADISSRPRSVSPDEIRITQTANVTTIGRADNAE